MAPRMTPEGEASRREAVLHAARWCFLNFGFAKTSLDDIARRAGISRTLLYRMFKDKEDIFSSVFRHWLMSRLPDAQAAAERSGNARDRLLDVCQAVAIEPWKDMFGAPMASEFVDACDRIDPEAAAHHRRVATECVASVLDDEPAAEVFMLAFDGLLADDPPGDVFEYRVRLLVSRFAPA